MKIEHEYNIRYDKVTINTKGKRMKKMLLAALLLTTFGVSDVKEDIKSCNGGNMASCNKLGIGYGTGEKGFTLDSSKARVYFTKACNGGNLEGCANLGYSYIEEKNYFNAMKYFTKACDGGNAMGCGSLGIMYSRGDGTKKDLVKSVEYFTKGCDGGYALACYKLGIGYYGGYAGRSQSFPKAKQLFNKACKGGIPMACDKYDDMKKKGY